MTLVILNLVLALLLFWFSTVIDISHENKTARPLVNMVLLLACNCIVAAICLILSFRGQSKLVSLLGRVFICGLTLQTAMYSLFTWRYPRERLSVLFIIVLVVLVGFSIFVAFFVIEKVYFSTIYGLQVVAGNMPITGISWWWFYVFFYSYIIPAIGLIGCIESYLRTKLRLIRQQIALLFLGFLAGEIILFLVHQIATPNFHPLYITLLTFAQAVTLFIFYQATRTTVLNDFKSTVRHIVGFVLNYAIIAILGGLLFAVLYVTIFSHRILFFSLYGLGLICLSIVRLKIDKKFRSGGSTHEYGSRLEKELASIDYTDPDLNVSQEFSRIIKLYTKTQGVSILIDNGRGFLSSVYATAEEPGDIDLYDKMFDVLVNENVTVVFRNLIDVVHKFKPVSKEIGTVMDATQSRVMILLKEGATVFGAILFKEKELGNLFNDYDLKTFNDLYSYFFLMGYYLKNIAHEEVVGTVRREIQFSGQVINSIQENMDPVTNPKFDVGYFSKSAHELGSEYIDFIKISPSRHIIVVGDLSGKGISASMSVVILKSVIRTFLAETSDFKELVQRVNLFIRDNLPRGTFFAGTFALLDEVNNMLYYINCGTLGLFMYTKAYNNVIEIQGEGRVLGFAKDVRKLVKVKKIALAPGDVLFTCTDGFTGARSLRNEEFGRTRLIKHVIENKAFPSKRMSSIIYDELLTFTSQELKDDATLLVVKVLAK